jgi:hypothetical protein
MMLVCKSFSNFPKTHTALGIEVESPERGTSEDLERKARPIGERQKEAKPYFDVLA